MVGLRQPDRARGVWRGKLLIGRRAVRRDLRELERRPGIRVLWRDKTLPMAAVAVSGRPALASLLATPSVDYVEPLGVPLEPQTALIGCDQPPIPDPEMHGHVESGDVLPWTYAAQQIPEAWRRSPVGRGITVGVLDTGAVRAQTQITPLAFGHGQSGDRTVANLGSNNCWFHRPDTPWTYLFARHARGGHDRRADGRPQLGRDRVAGEPRDRAGRAVGGHQSVE